MLSPEAVRVFRRDFEVLHVQNVTRLDEESRALVSAHTPALKQLQLVWILTAALPILVIITSAVSHPLLLLSVLMLQLTVSFVVTYLQMFLFFTKQQQSDQPVSALLKEEAVRFSKAYLTDYMKLWLRVIGSTFFDVTITMLVLYIAGVVLMSVLFGFRSLPSFFTLYPSDDLILQTRNVLFFGSLVAGIIRWAILMERYGFVDRLYIQNIIEQKNLTHGEIRKESDMLSHLLTYRLAYLYIWIRPLLFWDYRESAYFYCFFRLLQSEKNQLEQSSTIPSG